MVISLLYRRQTTSRTRFFGEALTFRNFLYSPLRYVSAILLLPCSTSSDEFTLSAVVPVDIVYPLFAFDFTCI